MRAASASVCLCSHASGRDLDSVSRVLPFAGSPQTEEKPCLTCVDGGSLRASLHCTAVRSVFLISRTPQSQLAYCYDGFTLSDSDFFSWSLVAKISMIVTATVTMRDGCGYGLRPRAAVNLTGSHWHHTVTKHASL